MWRSHNQISSVDRQTKLDRKCRIFAPWKPNPTLYADNKPHDGSNSDVSAAFTKKNIIFPLQNLKNLKILNFQFRRFSGDHGRSLGTTRSADLFSTYWWSKSYQWKSTDISVISGLHLNTRELYTPLSSSFGR